MSIIERVKNICLSPATEWPVIAREETPPGTLVSGYVAPLAAIGAVAGFIGGSVVGRSLPFIGTYRVPLMSGIGLAIFTFVMAIVGTFILSLVINALAPTFGGEKNSAQAFKVAVYSYTPAWVAGVLQILPVLGVLTILAALYGLYLLYLGLPHLMKCPQDKAVGYTVVVVVCAIVLSVVVASIGGIIAGAGMIGAGLAGGGTSGSAVQFDRDSPLGRLQELGQKLEESGRKIEEAERRGDTNAQVNAAVEGLGTLLGGGRRAEPISIEQLRPLVPETFAGMPRTRSNAEKTGFAGIMVSHAEATYSDGAERSVTLELTDTGGLSGLTAFAGWVGAEGEREDENSSERTHKVDGRLTHEKVSKTGGTNEFRVVVADRFVVAASGRGVDLNQLRGAVSALDLGRLESMRDAGVSR